MSTALVRVEHVCPLSSVPPIHNWSLPNIELLPCVLSFEFLLQCRLTL